MRWRLRVAQQAIATTCFKSIINDHHCVAHVALAIFRFTNQYYIPRGASKLAMHAACSYILSRNSSRLHGITCIAILLTVAVVVAPIKSLPTSSDGILRVHGPKERSDNSQPLRFSDCQPTKINHSVRALSSSLT